MATKAATGSGTQPFWKSKGFWGIAASLVFTTILPAFHLAPPPQDAVTGFVDSGWNAVMAVVDFASFALALWGRIVATKPLSLTK